MAVTHIDETSGGSDERDIGAIDWFLMEADDRDINGALVPPLLDLVDRRLIRLIDILVIVTDAAGGYEAMTTAELDVEVVGDLGPLAGASSGLLSDDDAAEAAALMGPDSLGLIVIYENLWSIPFAVAARKAGGRLLAQGHIPTQAIVAELERLET